MPEQPTAAELSRLPMQSRIKVVAHRGYSARWPENSVAGARAALRAGADLVEADVRLTSDGELFCIHDPTLARLAGLPDEVAQCTAVELSTLDSPGGGISPFRDIVGVVAESGHGIVVDVKLPGAAILAAIRRDLDSAGWPNELWLGVRHIEQVTEAPSIFGGRAHVLAFVPQLGSADQFVRAGAHAVRVWENEIGLPAVRELLPRTSIWVTAGGVRRPDVGDTDAAGMADIRHAGASGVLLNDPTLAVGAHQQVPGIRQPSAVSQESAT